MSVRGMVTIVALVTSSAMSWASAEKLFHMPYDAGKYAAKSAGMHNPSISISQAIDGGYEKCSSIFGGGCESVQIKYYSGSATAHKEQLGFDVKCGLAKYSGPAAKAFPNGRQFCTLVQ
ncbi:MAG: hypothetical protein K2X47_09885 [Bdellovibrionales bacterium]|nr:hypothetical protein [Bdellovibrionales bacterium]